MQTVLVVDDLKAQLNLISGYLEQEGFLVVTAAQRGLLPEISTNRWNLRVDRPKVCLRILNR